MELLATVSALISCLELLMNTHDGTLQVSQFFAST